jgi:hypothetical protein
MFIGYRTLPYADLSSWLSVLLHHNVRFWGRTTCLVKSVISQRYLADEDDELRHRPGSSNPPHLRNNHMPPNWLIPKASQYQSEVSGSAKFVHALRGATKKLVTNCPLGTKSSWVESK